MYILHSIAYVRAKYVPRTYPHISVYIPASLPLLGYNNMLCKFHFVPFQYLSIIRCERCDFSGRSGRNHQPSGNPETTD